jgi:hypothetical protein
MEGMTDATKKTFISRDRFQAKILGQALTNMQQEGV